MKQIVVLSGKGGTGKTSVVAALAHLASVSGPRLVLADADVDAANLELVLSPQRLETHPFRAGLEARIDEATCNACDKCYELCRFDAIVRGDTYHVDPFACEGCAVCATYCPTQAIAMHEPYCGDWHVSATQYGTLVHAGLFPGAENSGKLVTLVKSQAVERAKKAGIDVVLVDGPPGTGCPVIAATAGASAILAVTEPTPSGIHDLIRLLKLAVHFRIPDLLVCINKADLHTLSARDIEALCEEYDVPVVGRIPFDENVVCALIHGQPVTSIQEAPAAFAMAALWTTLRRSLQI